MCQKRPTITVPAIHTNITSAIYPLINSLTLFGSFSLSLSLPSPPHPPPPLFLYRYHLLPKTVSFKRDMYSSLKDLVVPVMEKHLLDIGEVWI